MSFNFLKIPVHIHPSFWFFLLFFSFDPTFSAIEIFILGLVFMLSFFVHEYGHAFVATLLGAKPQINLKAFIGNVSCQSNEIKEKQKYLIALSGPVFTLGLVLTSHYFLKENFFNYEYLNIFFYYMLRLNFLWLVTNFFPLEPLDMGRVLVYFLISKMEEQRALKISRSVGNVAAIVGASYFLSHGHYFFGTFFLFLGFNNLQKLDLLENDENSFFHKKA